MIYVIGFLAQAFFSARILFQWILSERAHKVVSPTIYWVLSMLGSYLLFMYGWLRDDFSIILGQSIAYYIYIWNLYEKGAWSKLHITLRSLLLLTPLAAFAYMIWNGQSFVQTFFRNENVPLWLVIFGSLGQVIFTLRFIYQWFYSYRRKESILPMGFWIISLVGSSIIISYGIFRLDPVLILGQSVGFVAYFRNIIIGRRDAKLQVKNG